MLINKEESLLIIIDVQERLAPAMENPRAIINGASKLLDVCQILNIPYLLTEQYPAGLGSTIFDVKKSAKENATYLAKTSFSCLKEEVVAKELKKHKKTQIILAGLETHICVLQTAIELKEKGYNVFVVADACGSRNMHQTSIALQRMMQNGIEIVSTEMVIFEWLEDSKNKDFKEISKKHL
ncbi:MAG: hydrolase [Alphaproteobacteria bacterium]